MVEELAAATPPSRYVRHEHDRPGLPGGALVGAADMPEPVPVIDLRRLLSCATDEGAQEACKLRSALQSWGIFLVSFFFERKFHGKLSLCKFC